MSTDLGGTMSLSVQGTLWISTLPGSADLSSAFRKGVTAVIDLRSPDPDGRDELAANCAAQGLVYSQPNSGDRDGFSDVTVDRVLAQLQSIRGQSVLLVGEDIGSAAGILAVHRIVHDRIKVNIAIAEARMCGMKPGDPETFVRRQAVRLRNPLGS